MVRGSKGQGNDVPACGEDSAGSIRAAAQIPARQACTSMTRAFHIMSIPGGAAPHFVMLHTDRSAGLETFLDFPSLPDRLDHLDQGGTQWRKDEVVRLLARIVNASADQQKVSPIICTPMRAGASRPNQTAVAPWSPDSSRAAANPPLGRRMLRP